MGIRSFFLTIGPTIGIAGSMLIASAVSMRAAAEQDRTVQSATLAGLMNGSAIAGEVWNSKGVPGKYQACHRPDGRIVGRSNYGSADHYAEGSWKVEGGKVCVAWTTKGWKGDCFSVFRAADGAGYDFKNSAGIRKVANGVFTPDYHEWCHDRF